jgi:hypothetical protein
MKFGQEFARHARLRLRQRYLFMIGAHPKIKSPVMGDESNGPKQLRYRNLESLGDLFDVYD